MCAVFIPSCHVCLFIHVSSPSASPSGKQLPVCLSMYLCAPGPGESMFCQLFLQRSKLQGPCIYRPSHSHCASFYPSRILLFRWDWPCRWSEGWKIETHNIHAKTHSNTNKAIIQWLLVSHFPLLIQSLPHLNSPK